MILTATLIGGSVLSRVVSGSAAQTQIASSKEMAKHDSPFACDRLALDPQARKRHFDELGPAMRAKVMNVRELPDGYEFELPNDTATFQLVAEWAAGERLCCPFFDIDLHQEREGGRFSMRLTGREGVKDFIKADLRSWIRK
jgi:hypothetical protein